MNLKGRRTRLSSKKKKALRKRLLVLFTVLLAIIAGVAGLVINDRSRRAAYPLQYRAEIEKAAAAYGLPVSLVFGVVHTESRFQPNAVSPVGAQGLMQIMPETGLWLAVKLGIDEYDLMDPETNLNMGCWYLNYLIGLFGDDYNAVLAGYNAGHNRVRGWMQEEEYTENGKLAVIPIKEAADYVQKVLSAQKEYQAIYGLE